MRVPLIALAGLATALTLLSTGERSPAALTQAPATVTLKSVTLTSKWKESWLTGSVRFSGVVSGPAELRVSLRPKAGGKLAAAVTLPDVQPGPFGGGLTLPNRLLPKVYRLTVTGESEGQQIAPVHRDVVLRAPPEGIVDRAWASATKNGPPVTTIPGNPSSVWAHFHFVVAPKSKKVRNRWYSPNFRWWGERKNKPWTRTVHTRVTAAKLDKGVWFAYVFSENRVVKRWRVRLG
jgi:hypothetical protein